MDVFSAVINRTDSKNAPIFMKVSPKYEYRELFAQITMNKIQV